MNPLASVSDLERLMKRTFSGADLDQADIIIDAVSAWARGVSGQPWPDAPVGVPSDVMYVVLSAARRVLVNPDGVTQESMGPFSKSYDKPPKNFFTLAELAILKRHRPRLNNGLFTVGFSRGEKANWGRVGHLFVDGQPMPVIWPNDPGYDQSWVPNARP